jgi:hypothetical protein
MEDKTITVGGEWNVRGTPGGIYVDDQFMGSKNGYARDIAHAILELIGDPVPGKGDDNYIAIKGTPMNWIGEKVIESVSGTPALPVRDFVAALSTIPCNGEYHIFRRVATVGPIPQPERKVTRYE